MFGNLRCEYHAEGTRAGRQIFIEKLNCISAEGYGK